MMTMPHRTLDNAIRAVGIAVLCATALVAQRHPESDRPNQYYRDDPGVPAEPPWKKRPPFLRGPLDRHERGRTRRFLATPVSVPYTNYAREEYVFYLNELEQTAGTPMRYRNVRWDRIGSYMGPSYRRVFSIEESRSSLAGLGSSMVDHRTIGFNRYEAALRSLYVGHYAYKGLHWSVTAGTDVRTRFTPLTLGRSHMKVARLDLNHEDRDLATILYSRGGQVGSSVLFSNWTRQNGDFTFEQSPVLLYGARWQRQIGDYARFGAAFVNQLMQFSPSPRSDALRGDLPYEMLGPRLIRVYVTDDSPLETGTNGRVFGMHLVLNGESEGRRVRLSGDSGDPDFDTRLAPTVTGGRELSGGGREAVGREAVVYEFSVPPELSVRSARFTADVADDYRIGIAQTHEFLNIDRRGDEVLAEQVWPAPFAPNEAASRRPFKWYIEEDEVPYFTVARSRGTPASGGNRHLVSFDYGMPTGQTLASVDWEFDLVGLSLSGEIAHNLQNYIYPVGANRGDRHTASAAAWWIKGLKALRDGLSVGGELYRMEPDYAGGYDSWRGGLPFHLDETVSGRVQSRTQEFPLLEDNDDNDQWPDEHPSEVPQGGEHYPGWPNSRTYPGLDENHDNIPDSDRNENFIPDWEEPFITYDSEPTDFVYGIDLNNNGVPDFRENDDRPDFPYVRDQKGHHLFAQYDLPGPIGGTAAVGRYDGRGIAGGGRSRATYLRYGYLKDRPGLGLFRVDYDLKRVKDDIEDHTYVHVIPPDDVDVVAWINQPDGPPWSPGLHRPATPDSLFMRDSWVSTAFVETRYRAVGNLIVETAFLWRRNSQAEIAGTDGFFQPDDIRSRLSLVNKLSHEWSHRALTVQARFKHRLRYHKIDSEADARTSSSDFIPICTLTYRLTEGTHFLAGVQGFPLLPFKHWDRARADGTYTQRDYLLMVRIRSEYFGITDNNLFFGYQLSRRDYSRFRERDTRRSALFAELVSPF